MRCTHLRLHKVVTRVQAQFTFEGVHTCRALTTKVEYIYTSSFTEKGLRIVNLHAWRYPNLPKTISKFTLRAGIHRSFSIHFNFTIHTSVPVFIQTFKTSYVYWAADVIAVEVNRCLRGCRFIICKIWNPELAGAGVHGNKVRLWVVTFTFSRPLLFCVIFTLVCCSN